MAPGYGGRVDLCRRVATLKFSGAAPFLELTMTPHRRLLGALALRVCRSWSPPPLPRPRPTGRQPVPDSTTTATRTCTTPATCGDERRQGVEATSRSPGAQLVRTFVNWHMLQAPARPATSSCNRLAMFVDKARAREHPGHLHRDRPRRHRWPTPAAVRQRRSATLAHQLRGQVRRLRGLERGGRERLLAQRPAARRLHRAAEGGLPGGQGRRPGRQRCSSAASSANNFEFLESLYKAGRQGLLRRRRRPHRHRLPDHRPARVLPRAERARRALLVHRLPRGARHDARPRRRQADLDDRARLVDHQRHLQARRSRRHQGGRA